MQNVLSEKEMTRYSRQMFLDKWGSENQQKLKNTTVFVAGAGGSGSPLIEQLALLGFGTIIISDFDEVELSNLNRQSLHDESRIGINKAISAKMTVERINPHVNVIAYPEKITRENVDSLVGEAEVIFDNVDDVEAKLILSECAVKKGIPQVLSSMIDINSYAVILYPPHTPCFNCLYDKEKIQQIAELKSLSTYDDSTKRSNPVSSPALFVSTGFIVNEVLKIILGIGQPAYNKYFLFNQKGSEDIVYTDGHLMITYPFSNHFRNICKEQGFDWNIGWRGKFVEELDIIPDPGCPVCGGK
ncbi:MAG: HesA/MoeB/ThiF family protein [Halanaerobiales bacterium]|nr:HesA/MoeB/ThiF family protein [Halanaerobiales bacterium]